MGSSWMITAALILSRPTGIAFESEAGGAFREQRKLEGIYMPLCVDIAPLTEHFSEPGSKYVGACFNNIDEETAQFLDDYFARELLPLGDIRVDRSVLNQSTEAWVFVIANGEKAVFNWPNSD